MNIPPIGGGVSGVVGKKKKGRRLLQAGKPKLDIEGQVEHLRKKGIKFEIIPEDKAKIYLSKNNYYFKLSAYRKNYPKHPGGINKGKYINLDFAYLVDLASIDMHLRYILIHMALDIEHFAKVKLVNFISASGEDGYDIVADFISAFPQDYQDALFRELDRNAMSPYCGDIVNKYKLSGFPIWAFVEIIPFGRFVTLYKFCADRLSNRDMLDDYYLMQYVKDLRNASAHNNCIINDLKPNTSRHSTNHKILAELGRIGISKRTRARKMSSERIQQIVTLYYSHRKIVTSAGVSDFQSKTLHSLVGRILRHIEYYKSNDTLKSVFSFLKIIVDNWFPSDVECGHVEKDGSASFAERDCVE